RSLTAVLTLDTPAHTPPLPGQPARLRVARVEETRGYWLPTAALTASTRGLWSCYAVVPAADGYAVERREVEIIHVGTERILVRGMLEAGDLVIRDGVHRVTPGQAVEPMVDGDRNRTDIEG